jgi:2-polyprenyl-6-methoxyphenol hydroxylase-like FAD-dependent oxidoreductase
MGRRSVLISGMGIAGPTLAWWLNRHGCSPTLVERAPALRQGGYMIDFWGSGFDVADRMGLLPAIRREGYRIEELRMIDGSGRRIGVLDTGLFRSMLADRFVSIERGALARLVFDTVKDDVETLFGDTVVAIERAGAGVGVTFQSAAPRAFDLVVGADGLHSRVRSLAFGAEPSFERHLGLMVAAFTIPGYPHRDDGVYVSYCVPGRQVARYALRDGRTGFLMVFRGGGERGGDLDDEAARGLLGRTFGQAGWECAEILEAMDAAPEIYVYEVSQIRMPSWSSGRIVLLGDAAFCPSLLAGEGASLAMGAAYVLAGELMRSDGNHERAFRRYEDMFRPFAERKQDGATLLGSWFAPKTRLGVFVRNQATRLMNVPPIGRWTVGRMVADRFPLPDYG